MQESDIKIVLSKTTHHASESLAQDVWFSIIKKQNRQMRWKRISYGIASVASIAFLVPIVIGTAQQLAATGFVQYASLLFSDTGLITTLGKEILYTLGETLPAGNIAICLLLLLLFGYSLKEFFKTQVSQLSLSHA